MATPALAHMCASMEWNCPDKATAFAKFKLKCERLFNSYYKGCDEKEKVIYVLLWLGDEGDQIFQLFSWTNAATDPHNLGKVFEKFEKYFMPVTTHRLYRYQLMNLKQGSQPVDAFVTDMKTLAQKCKFKDNEAMNDRVLDQLIWGCSSHEAQKQLIGWDEKLKIDEAVSIIRTHEATKAQMQSLNNIAPAAVNAINQSRRGRDSYQTRGNAQRGQSNTRHKNECFHCGKSGYGVNECYYKNRDQSTRRDASSENNAPWRGENQSRGQRGRRGRGRRGRGRSRSRNRNFHMTEQNAGKHIKLDTIQINKINSDNDKRSQVFAPITIWKHSQKKSYEVKCKVDTGAEGNILPISYFRKLYPEKLDATGNPKPNAIQPNEVILSAYGGGAITNLGQIDIPCSYNDTKFTGKFFVTDAAGPIILGLNTSRALKLITLHCSAEKVESPVTESHSTQRGINEPSASLTTKKKVRFQEATPEMGRAREKTNTYVPSDTPLQERPRVRDKAHVKSMYPECFDDSEKKPRYFSITLEQNSSGKIDALHRVPLELKDRLKTKLDQMVKDGVITRETEPTDWVNSLIIREKPNGDIRICLDPSNLNKSIKRPYYPTPTVEETTPKFAGSKLFSKLDAKDGYWNIRLDRKSSLLTTFNTPFGRYRYLKLPFSLNASQDIFQQLMDDTYVGCKGAAGIADDIQVFGVNEAQHDLHLHKALERTRQARIKLNYDKCHITQESVKFFGNAYSANRVSPDPERVNVIKQIDPPRNKSELHTFLGMVNNLRQYIQNLSSHTVKLRELLHEDR